LTIHSLCNSVCIMCRIARQSEASPRPRQALDWLWLPFHMVSRGILSLVLPPLKTGRATFTASGFQKSLGCQVVSLLVTVEVKVF
jgi:hypothetical protein